MNITISHSASKAQCEGGYQKSWFVGSLCLCGLLGPYALRLLQDRLQTLAQPRRELLAPCRRGPSREGVSVGTSLDEERNK